MTDRSIATGPAGLAAAADTPAFVARAPWWGGDLQTLRNFLLRESADLSAWPAERLDLPIADGSGDRLLASLHRVEGAQSAPLAVLIHGLTGCEDSSYVRATARHLLGCGYPVLRLNLRGAGPSRALCRGQYHAGRSEDLRDALLALRAFRPAAMQRGLLLVGYSLGANMLLKFLAEHAAGFPILAAAAVSAPIDLKAAQVRIMAPRNAVYHHYLLARMKQEALAVPGVTGAEERRAIRALRTVYAFDEHRVAPQGGFAGADDYYRRCSARQFLAGIAVPTLVIHALDDPWIPAASYATYDWRRAEAVTPLLPAGGGHVGFHGQGSTPWHNLRIADFFAGRSVSGPG